ncbi:unnamed protein product [Caenorhabditis brenneri]
MVKSKKGQRYCRRDDKTEFPLHNLDSFSLNEIFKNLPLTDVFELSFTTEEVRRAVHEASVPIHIMHVSFDSKEPSICLKSPKHQFTWTFGVPEQLELVDRGEYKIGKFQYDCKSNEDGYFTQHYDAEHGMVSVLKYLVSVFDCSEAIIKELSIDVGVIEDSRSIFQHFINFKSIERMAIHQSVDKEGNRLNLIQHIDWIMSNLKTDEFYMGVELLEHRMIRTPEGEFDIRPVPMRLEKALKINHVALMHSEWVTKDDLLNLNVQTAIFEGSKLTSQDLNAFLHQWIKTASDKLWWLKVKTNDNFNFEEVINGLDVQEDTYKEQNIKCSCPYLRTGGLECEPFEFPETSKQITNANGTTATVSVHEDTFFFHVKNDGPITPKPPVVREPTEEQRMIMDRIEQLNVETARLHAQRVEFEMVRRNRDREDRDDHDRMMLENRLEHIQFAAAALREELRNLEPR